MRAVLGDEPRRLHAQLFQRLRLQLLDPHPLLGAEHLTAVDGVGQLVELGLEVAPRAPGGGQLLLAKDLGGLRGGPLLLRTAQRHLDMGEQLPRTGGDGLRDGRLVPQPRPSLLGTRACLALRTRGPVQRVGPSGEPLDPLLVRTDLEAGLHLGLPGVGPVGGETVPYRRVGLLLDRHLLGDGQPLGEFLDLLQGLVERLLRPRGRGDGPLGLTGGAARLAREPPELLGDRRLLPVGGPAPLPQLLDLRGALLAPLGRRVLCLGQLLAPHGQLFQLARGLVHGRLYLEQTGRPRGTAVREVRAQQIALGRDGGEVRAGVHQVLGVLQGADDDDPAQQAPYGGHELGGAPDEVGGVRRPVRP